MRSLILTGLGLKAAFQAGVLQVWLDEAGLSFDHADGVSTGCLNLAMYCQGMNGREMAECWKRSEPLAAVELGWEHYWRLVNAPSFYRLDRYRDHVLRDAWRLDWDRIRAPYRVGTFNLCNFSKFGLEVVPNERMTEELLVASISLPMWFPPVVVERQTYVDAVFLSGANLEEAIRRGADEIWAIWTTSRSPIWRDGFVSQYFHIAEITSNAHFFEAWRRIERSNAEIDAGRPGEFGRKIALRLLQAEVPIHYLIDFSQDRVAEAVHLGVETARRWCDQSGVDLPRRGRPVAQTEPGRTRLRFSEEMKGDVTPGEIDFRKGKRSPKRVGCRFRLTIVVDDVDSFVTSPSHEARAEGWVEVDPIGDRLPISKGYVRLVVDAADPSRRQMLYRLLFADPSGRPLTLSGHKSIRDDGLPEHWTDTTTLFTRLFRGHVAAADEPSADLYGSGLLSTLEIDFVRQLGTFRVDAPTPEEAADALLRFGRLFFGKLWETYGQRYSGFSRA